MIKNILCTIFFVICTIGVLFGLVYISENMTTKFQILCFWGSFICLVCLQIFFNRDEE